MRVAWSTILTLLGSAHGDSQKDLCSYLEGGLRDFKQAYQFAGAAHALQRQDSDHVESRSASIESGTIETHAPLQPSSISSTEMAHADDSCANTTLNARDKDAPQRVFAAINGLTYKNDTDLEKTFRMSEQDARSFTELWFGDVLKLEKNGLKDLASNVRLAAILQESTGFHLEAHERAKLPSGIAAEASGSLLVQDFFGLYEKVFEASVRRGEYIDKFQKCVYRAALVGHFVQISRAIKGHQPGTDQDLRNEVSAKGYMTFRGGRKAIVATHYVFDMLSGLNRNPEKPGAQIKKDRLKFGQEIGDFKHLFYLQDTFGEGVVTIISSNLLAR